MSATQEFRAPEITEDNYYERIGAPQSADSSEINNHTKKYVAEFKPELSTHENAEERWKRFNRARQTLTSSDSKDDYDTFLERFPDQATEAYESWQAQGEEKLGDPNNVSPEVLGLRPDVDDSTGSGRNTTTSTHTQEQKTDKRTKRKEKRRERRQAGHSDIDTDRSKTYSTRATARTQAEDADTGTEASTSSPGTFSQVINRARSAADTASTEVSIMFSLFDLVLIGYLLYFVLVGIILSNVPSGTVQSIGAIIIGLTLIGGVSWEYLDRFEARFTAGGVGSVRDYFTSSDNPTRLLALPAVSSVLWGIILLVGGGALTTLLWTVSLMSLYGRLRAIKHLIDLPDWTDYVGPAAGIFASAAFVLLFVQSGQVPDAGGLMTGADTQVIVGLGALLMVLVGLPVAAVGQRLTE